MKTDEHTLNKNSAPYPNELDDLVRRCHFRPGWTFDLRHIDRGQSSVGLTLIITTKGYNSYHPEQGENYRVHHYMIVPAASYNRRSWRRWLLTQCMTVDDHEAMEFFAIDDEHPYAPNHGPGNDPYIIAELTTDEDVRTSFRGEVKEPA
jgi:hypothetical protein